VNAAQAREQFASARVARLATVSATGAPHLVPVTFALLGEDTIVFAVDHKPKRTRALQRLANIAAEPRVALLVDAYGEDWSALWWARADGVAAVVESGVAGFAGAVEALASRYAQYRSRPPQGPAVVVAVTRWSGWRATP
jgi:PPOX class probable F420-dependent enzyme